MIYETIKSSQEFSTCTQSGLLLIIFISSLQKVSTRSLECVKFQVQNLRSVQEVEQPQISRRLIQQF
jgi:hypothetical protein